MLGDPWVLLDLGAQLGSVWVPMEIWDAQAALATLTGQVLKVLKSAGTCFCLELKRSGACAELAGTNHWGPPKSLGSCPSSSRLLSTHIPSPGHAKAAGVFGCRGHM